VERESLVFGLRFASQTCKNKTMSDSEGGAESGSEEQVEEEVKLQLPLARVKKIVKCDPDVKSISNDGAILIGKATVIYLFILSVIWKCSFLRNQTKTNLFKPYLSRNCSSAI
jgi:hypothetical protein